MSNNVTIFNTAYQAFNDWDLLPTQKRVSMLGQFKLKIDTNLLPAFEYQFQHTLAIIDKTESLICPTGETNELYTQGRGVSVLLITTEEDNVKQAIIAMLISLLLAGNSVIICSDNQKLDSFLLGLIESVELPKGLLQVMTKGTYSKLIKQDIRNFIYIGDRQTAITLNQELSVKQNAITSLLAETDLINLPNSKDPMLALHFVTERVRTINVTAIGGNAMLLELGGDSK